MLRPQLNNYRYLIDLSGIWKLKIDPEERGESSGWNNFFESELDVAVPGSWNEQLQEEGLMNYTGTVWYTKKINVPKEFKGKRIWVWIGSADYHAKVWMNGKLAGEHLGGFLPINFEVTDYVFNEHVNSLVIKVNNRLSPDTIPQGISKQNYIEEDRMREETFPPARFDFFPCGGINRQVFIYATSQNLITDVTVKTTLKDESNCSVNVDVEFDSVNEGILNLTFNGYKNSKEISGEIKNNSAKFSLDVKDGKLWSPEDPYLYDLILELKVEGKIVDKYSLEIGLREIKIDGDKLLLNNKPIFLKGFGKHEDFPITGKALNLPLLIKDFSLLKWVNANSFRTSHYPYAEEAIELADRRGILVIAEVPAVSLDFRHTTQQTLVNHKNAIKELIDRDKNHPSVIIWALGNEPNLAGESEYHDGRGEKYWKEIFEYAKSLDPSRPLTVPNCPRAGKDDPVFLFSDFISINRYYGWYENPGQIELGVKRMEEEMDYLAEKYKKPVFISEFGTDTMPGLHSTEPTMFTEEYQSEFIKAYCKLIESKNYTIGEHIWNFADFRTPQIFRRVVLNLKGVFTRTRDPKAAAFLLKELWSKNK